MSETASHPLASRLAPALRSRNFRLFWLAQIVSNTGAALQVVAEGWLIYDLTESTFWLGAAGFIALLPALPIALLGGLLIDRVSRRKLIMATQAGLMLQAGLFAALSLSGRLQLWHVIGLYFLFGALLAIDHPARRAFLVDLVPGRDLANAVALNATIFNIAGLVGYAAAGLLIATIGAGGAMLFNAASYLAPLLALAAIRIADAGRDPGRRPVGAALTEGLLTLWRQPALLGIIGLMAVAGGLAWPVFGLMPAFAEGVLGTGSIGLGLLLAAGALGSVMGTLAVARLGAQRRGRSLTAAAFLLPLLTIGLARSNAVLSAALFMIAIGLVLLVLQSLAITLVQINIPDRVRGRVMSLYSILHAGADSGSNLIIGALAIPLGLPLALALGGAAALVFAVIVWLALPVVRGLD
jgi:hypothetical protein